MTSWIPEYLTREPAPRWRSLTKNFCALRFATYEEAENYLAHREVINGPFVNKRVVEFDGPAIASWKDYKFRWVPPGKNNSPT